ncbi:hypothetical protein T492DRAFT_957123 [Pavlovales sp. CCMP2436]|nr:hypothetical protein T492DRAFT_957123 [Pavlovales sp. CCMP2436]
MGACTTAPSRLAAGTAKLRGRAARSTSLELAACGGASPRFYLPGRLCDAAGLSSKGTHGRQLMLHLPADAPVGKDDWYQLGATARSRTSTLADHVGWGVAILSDQYTGEVRALSLSPQTPLRSGAKRASTMDPEALRLLILETCPKNVGARISGRSSVSV